MPKLREFDALCLPPVEHYSAGQIKKLRLRYKASQAVFAAYSNTSPSTVQNWEQGEVQPNGPTLKRLNIVDRKVSTRLAHATLASLPSRFAMIDGDENALAVAGWGYFQPRSLHTPMCTPISLPLGQRSLASGAACPQEATMNLEKRASTRSDE